jgi:hypothetical protein
MISLTKVQLPVLEKIPEYLINNLGFDKYSKFKLHNTRAIAIVENKERNNSKPNLRLVISNTNILTNYLLPFFSAKNLTFLTKKSQDFKDFKIISGAIYIGAHREEEIKSCRLKLSYTMNNYRLSTGGDNQQSGLSNNTEYKKISILSNQERGLILNAKPTIIHLSDGRNLDIITKKEVNRQSSNCVYEIVKSSGEIFLSPTLNKAD